MMSQLTMSGAEKMKMAFNKYKTNPVAKKLKVLAPGDHYNELDARLKTADWYHKGLPKYVINVDHQKNRLSNTHIFLGKSASQCLVGQRRARFSYCHKHYYYGDTSMSTNIVSSMKIKLAGISR